MQKNILPVLSLGAILFWAALLPGIHAQSDASKSSVGTINIAADKASLNSTVVHLIGHAKIVSENYDLYAADIKVLSSSGAKQGSSNVRQAIAEGGATPGTQVVTHIRQPLQSALFTISSDRAVYQPDNSRPSGATLTFTGHVQVITKSGFLAEPSVSNTDTATILLGIGTEYPQVNTGPLHATLTPSQ